MVQPTICLFYLRGRAHWGTNARSPTLLTRQQPCAKTVALLKFKLNAGLAFCVCLAFFCKPHSICWCCTFFLLLLIHFCLRLKFHEAIYQVPMLNVIFNLLYLRYNKKTTKLTFLANVLSGGRFRISWQVATGWILAILTETYSTLKLI